MIRELTVNKLIDPVDKSSMLAVPARILDIDHDRKVVLIMSLEINLKKPWVLSIESLLNEIECGFIRIVAGSPEAYMLKAEYELSEREINTRNKNWELIEALVDNKLAGEVLGSESFGRTVAEHASRMGVTRKRIYELLYRYWAGGYSKNAFLWKTTNWGNPGKKKTYRDGIIAGRKPKYRGVVIKERAIPIRRADMLYMETAFKRFRGRREPSMASSWSWMLNKFYRSVSIEGRIGSILRGQHPTLAQFKYYAKKHFDKVSTFKGRAGQTRWNKDYRALKGTAIDDLYGPGQRYEIDATIADIYLVHRVNRNWLIGRPILYVVVDAYSRMIVGIHVGLEGPSWEGARHALYNAFNSKVVFCKRYGIEISEDEWPCHHIPMEISADRAEMLSGAGEILSTTLGVKVKIAPAFRPDWKSIVESRFKLINEGLSLKFIPGGVDARRLERGDRDYELDAILDIDQFTNIVIEEVINHNNNLHLPHLATNDMIADEIELNPLSIWTWGQENSIVRLKTKTDAEIKISLLPSTEATVRRGGIYLQGVLYTCASAEQEGWFEISHNMRMMRVRVWYDPNSVENVWIKDGSEFIPLHLVSHQLEKYSGFRQEEIIDRICALSNSSPDERYRALNGKSKVISNTDAKITEAREMKEKNKSPMSKNRFKAEKRAKRALELEVERASDVACLTDIHSNNVFEPEHEKSDDKDLRSARKASILKLVSASINKST